MKKQIQTLILISFISFNLQAQSFISRIIRGEDGISKQYAAIDAAEKIPFNAAQLKLLLNLNPKSDLILKKTEQDDIGFIHYRFYQTYKGVPVENSMYIVHTKKGLLESLGGAIITDFDPLTDVRSTQKISTTQAINVAVQYVGATKYAWQDAGLEAGLKEQTNNIKASYFPKATLAWFSPTDNISPKDLRLCYKVDVYAREPLSRAYYFVDAITGKVIGQKDEIFFSDVTGTAATAYSGSVTIHSGYSGTDYRLRDYTKGSGIITLHGESATRGNNYTSTSANWSLSGTNQAALDAHYGVSQTYAFYKANFNRNSYDNAGSALYSYVNDPTYTDNAFWDGTAMNFCKRSNSGSHPGGTTGIDITGHELTHGVTQETSALQYSKEPGAINESMSDIMGKSVQFWSKPTDINWLLSNDMNWTIRSMSNPNLEGQPDTYKGTDWYSTTGCTPKSINDNCGVHTNSGVGNFMFYLLVTGGSGTNDIGNAYSVTGIGLTKADQILYRTNTTYLTPASQYADWRTACINAATDLYGSTSNEVVQVENAWYAVGVGTAAGSGACNIPTGLATSSVSSTSAVITWAAADGAVTYNLRYKDSTTSIWDTITGIATTSYSLIGLKSSTTYIYQVQSACSAGATSANSAAKSFKTAVAGSITYCSITGSTTYEYINKISLGSINNTSGNNNGYRDYTSLSTNLVAGSTVSISLTAGYANSAYPEYWTVFIDYNHDGVFAGSNEKVVQDHITGTLTKSFTVAANAKQGQTRMRVIMQFGAARTETCGTYTGGEAEDYTVNITSAGGIVALNKVPAAGLNNIMVTPNPVKSSAANIVLLTDKTEPVNIIITDLSGRIIKSEIINNIVVGKNNYPLHNLNMLPGTYMIVAQQLNRVIARAQFIVAK